MLCLLRLSPSLAAVLYKLPFPCGSAPTVPQAQDTRIELPPSTHTSNVPLSAPALCIGKRGGWSRRNCLSERIGGSPSALTVKSCLEMEVGSPFPPAFLKGSTKLEKF